jgi:hypothetical protein
MEIVIQVWNAAPQFYIGRWSVLICCICKHVAYRANEQMMRLYTELLLSQLMGNTDCILRWLLVDYVSLCFVNYRLYRKIDSKKCVTSTFLL